MDKPVPFGEGGLPLTTKKADGHGYGLQNVVALFKKNKMDYAITCQNGWFQVSAMCYPMPA